VGDRSSTGKSRSNVARLFKLSYQCADWAWAGPRLVQLAARQPDSGRTASGKVGCVGAIMCPFICDRSPTGIGHPRSRSFIEPPSAYASASCWRLPQRIGDVLLLLACPRWPTLIRRLEVPCTSKTRENTKFDSIPSQPEVSRPQRKRDRGGIVPATTVPQTHWPW
jgi:hypothetical protein